MHIIECYKNKNFVLSFELNPPRNGEGLDKVFECVERLLRFKPAFFTITQSSGGSLRAGTDAISHLIKSKYGIECMSHLTCMGKNSQDVENQLMRNHYLGIDNIMALRGDPPWGEKEFIPKQGGFKYAFELVEEVKRKNMGKYITRPNDWKFFDVEKGAKYRIGEKTNFCIGVAGYPEGHKECKDKELNIEHLKQKVDAGADLVFTQMFFRPEYYFEFVEDCRKAGITVPIIAGLLPISFLGQVNFIQNTCAVEIPKEYLNKIVDSKNDKEKITEVSIEFITKLCKKLMDKGVPGLHFFTLNNWEIVENILDQL